MMTLGILTLAIFILRCVAFTFRESPKFLLSKGLDAHALDVLFSIAKFNKGPPPSLHLDDFRALDYADTHKALETQNKSLSRNGRSKALSTGSHAKQVALGGFVQTFGHLRGLFANKRCGYLFIVMSIA